MKSINSETVILNTLERRVVRNGVFLDMTPRTFDVLQMLVERPCEIVTKDEILGTVWNGSFVEEGNLPVHISKLRRLLDESRTERFIETVQGTGYRFISPVQSADESEWQTLASTPFTLNPESHRLYLKGKCFLEKRSAKDIYKAIECFENSVSYDPENLLSHVMRVECYVLLHTFNHLSHADASVRIKPILLILSWGGLI